MLEALAVFRSGDADQTQRFLNGIGFGFGIDGRGTVDTRLNGAYFPNLWLGYTQYGAAVTIDAGERPDFWLQLPLRGGIEIDVDHRRTTCDLRTGAITSPDSHRVIRMEARSARLQVSLIAPALQRQLAALLCDWPREPLKLAPSMDLTQGYGRSIAQLIRLAVGEFETERRVAWNPLVISQFEQLLMTRLLVEHQHNHSDAVRRYDRPVSPRGVKRAVDYMHANLDAPITLADLVAVAGVPGRTLFQHFRAFKGVPPMRYLRQRRMEQARRALMCAAPEENVTAIAVHWGFAHMGRFAIEYRRRFGESPSRTLAQGRAAMADPRYAQAMAAQRLGLPPGTC